MFYFNLNDFDYLRNYNFGYMCIFDIYECRSDLYNKRFFILKFVGGVICIVGVYYIEFYVKKMIMFNSWGFFFKNY